MLPLTFTITAPKGFVAVPKSPVLERPAPELKPRVLELTMPELSNLPAAVIEPVGAETATILPITVPLAFCIKLPEVLRVAAAP